MNCKQKRRPRSTSMPYVCKYLNKQTFFTSSNDLQRLVKLPRTKQKQSNIPMITKLKKNTRASFACTFATEWCEWVVRHVRRRQTEDNSCLSWAYYTAITVVFPLSCHCSLIFKVRASVRVSLPSSYTTVTRTVWMWHTSNSHVRVGQLGHRVASELV